MIYNIIVLANNDLIWGKQKVFYSAFDILHDILVIKDFKNPFIFRILAKLRLSWEKTFDKQFGFRDTKDLNIDDRTSFNAKKLEIAKWVIDGFHYYENLKPKVIEKNTKKRFFNLFSFLQKNKSRV